MTANYSGQIIHLERTSAQWVVIALKHPDLTARVLLEAGIAVVSAIDTPIEFGIHNEVYPILCNGDRDDISEAIERHLNYFETYLDPATLVHVLRGELGRK